MKLPVHGVRLWTAVAVAGALVVVLAGLLVSRHLRHRPVPAPWTLTVAQLRDRTLGAVETVGVGAVPQDWSPGGAEARRIRTAYGREADLLLDPRAVQVCDGVFERAPASTQAVRVGWDQNPHHYLFHSPWATPGYTLTGWIYPTARAALADALRLARHPAGTLVRPPGGTATCPPANGTEARQAAYDLAAPGGPARILPAHWSAAAQRFSGTVKGWQEVQTTGWVHFGRSRSTPALWNLHADLVAVRGAVVIHVAYQTNTRQPGNAIGIGDQAALYFNSQLKRLNGRPAPTPLPTADPFPSGGM